MTPLKPIEMSYLNGCARCHSDGHADLIFYPLTHPVKSIKGTIIATHWAMCPIVEEPILMTETDEPIEP